MSDIKILIKNIIQNNDYSLTYIDIYLLCKKYQIPLIIICNTSIHFPIINSNFIVVNPELSLEPNFKGFYFIKVPTSYTRGIKNYKLLHFESSILFNIDLDINKSGNDDIVLLKNEINKILENKEDILENVLENLYNTNTLKKNSELYKKIKTK